MTLLTGTLLAQGRRTVAAALHCTGNGMAGNWSSFHQVLDRACRSPLAVSRQLLLLIVETFVPAGACVDLVIDETLERRWGSKIRKRGHYRDSALSSRERGVEQSWPAMDRDGGRRHRALDEATLGVALFMCAGNHPGKESNGSAAVFLSTSHHLQVVRYDSTGKKHVTTTTSVLATGQWYSIELDQTNAAVGGSWSLWLNGTQIAGETAVDTGNTLVTAIIAGDTQNSVNAMAGSFYEDNVLTAAHHIG